ncbi:hypothetical protein [Geopsychrobacter electrodiphilus]|uniref:hypothetical protein n=1 Tax=Geopsychrobacter electrodiphilus TaxID=225196 RepID=UPI000368AF16|nr:hypothetical protein [Geopsychrobacter electrodiphilus]
MKPHGLIRPYQKPLLQILLLIFVVLASGGTFSTNLTSAQSGGKTCFSVKVGSDSLAVSLTKIDHVLHVAPAFTPKVLGFLRISVVRHTPQSAISKLTAATPCRAPPGAFLA